MKNDHFLEAEKIVACNIPIASFFFLVEMQDMTLQNLLMLSDSFFKRDQLEYGLHCCKAAVSLCELGRFMHTGITLLLLFICYDYPTKKNGRSWRSDQFFQRVPKCVPKEVHITLDDNILSASLR